MSIVIIALRRKQQLLAHQRARAVCRPYYTIRWKIMPNDCNSNMIGRMRSLRIKLVHAAKTTACARAARNVSPPRGKCVHAYRISAMKH